MKKRGFTLIELLAVIVILAIIALITVPVIFSIINSARLETDKRSAENYIKAAEQYFAINSLEDSMLSGVDLFSKIEVNGKKATSGNIVVDEDGNVQMAIVINDRCFKKYYTDTIDNIIISDDIEHCNVSDMITKLWEFDFTNDVQEFIVPNNGKYKLEVWGAQGGNGEANQGVGYQSTGKFSGGLGGYATGTITLEKNSVLYIVVGGQGGDTIESSLGLGGYNGGGSGGTGYSIYGGGSGGGGATHISTTNRGLLSEYNTHRDELLIVAGGGGGNSVWGYNYALGNGGGYAGGTGYGSNNQGGTQTTFGIGQDGRNSNSFYSAGAQGNPGAGGGFYGGFSTTRQGDNSNIKAGGGSGYISPLLSDAYMAGKDVPTSDDETIRTISVVDSSEIPTTDYAKEGNGYVRITLIYQ